MSDEIASPGGAPARHGAATTIAEQALQAQARGDDDEADRLFAEAARIDPEAVNAVLSQGVIDPATVPDPGPQNDAEIAAMTRTVGPDSDAPSRANITGPGSGADNQS